MKSIFLVLLFCVLSSCTRRPETAAVLLQHQPAWTLAFADTFADGGSVTLSFLSRDGEIIHLWAQAPVGVASSQRQFFLKRRYNDPEAVEVLPGSAVEQRVLQLLGSYEHRTYIDIPASYPRRFAALLRDRHLSFPSPADWSRDP